MSGLGQTTATGDTEGEILQTRPTDGIDVQQIESVLTRFRGEIEQMPPMYSALKHQGKRLYELARARASRWRASRARCRSGN